MAEKPIDVIGTLKRTEMELANMLDCRKEFSPEWVEIMRSLHTQVRRALSDNKWGPHG